MSAGAADRGEVSRQKAAAKQRHIPWEAPHLGKVLAAYVKLRIFTGNTCTGESLSRELRRDKYRMIEMRGAHPTTTSCARLLTYHGDAFRKRYDNLIQNAEAAGVDVRNAQTFYSYCCSALVPPSMAALDSGEPVKDAQADRTTAGESAAGTAKADTQSESESESDSDSSWCDEDAEDEDEDEDDDGSGGDSSVAAVLADKAAARVEPGDIIQSIRAFADELKEMQDKHARLKAKHRRLKDMWQATAKRSNDVERFADTMIAAVEVFREEQRGLLADE